MKYNPFICCIPIYGTDQSSRSSSGTSNHCYWLSWHQRVSAAHHRNWKEQRILISIVFGRKQPLHGHKFVPSSGSKYLIVPLCEMNAIGRRAGEYSKGKKWQTFKVTLRCCGHGWFNSYNHQSRRLSYQFWSTSDDIENYLIIESD